MRASAIALSILLTASSVLASTSFFGIKTVEAKLTSPTLLEKNGKGTFLLEDPSDVVPTPLEIDPVTGRGRFKASRELSKKLKPLARSR